MRDNGLSSEEFRKVVTAAFDHRQVARFIIERGVDFEPVQRPKGVRKRRDRNCYINAQTCVLEGCQREIFRGAQYVEGYACPSGGALVPIKHGWITLDGVHAVDVTWREPGVLYRGIVIPSKALADHILRTGTMGDMLTEIVCKPPCGFGSTRPPA